MLLIILGTNTIKPKIYPINAATPSITAISLAAENRNGSKNPNTIIALKISPTTCK